MKRNLKQKDSAQGSADDQKSADVEQSKEYKNYFLDYQHEYDEDFNDSGEFIDEAASNSSRDISKIEAREARTLYTENSKTRKGFDLTNKEVRDIIAKKEEKESQGNKKEANSGRTSSSGKKT
jgi:multidrug efflux pump subunit AcrA (membrane-fusion protein)